MTTIYPVIMSGGSGNRLWPVSRRAVPKQFHALVTGQSMLAETLHRLKTVPEGVEVAPPVIICNHEHKELVHQSCREAGIEAKLLLEPAGRNTAAVAAIAARVTAQTDVHGLTLLLPADHYIEDTKGFWESIAHAQHKAADNAIVTFGIKPDRAHTGYGYIEYGNPIEKNIYSVRTFTEKPDHATAHQYLANGNYVWNAGIFLFSAHAMLKAFQELAPDILINATNALDTATHKNNCLLLDETAFAKCPSISLDYAIMEKTSNIAVVAPLDIGWSDIGTWSSLQDVNPKHSNSNSDGKVIRIESTGTFIHTEGPLVATLGVENLIIVATKDAILVLPKDRAEEVRKITDLLEKNDLESLL